MSIQLSADQKNCIDAIMAWWEDGRSPLLIGGGEEFFHIFHGVMELLNNVKI